MFKRRLNEIIRNEATQLSLRNQVFLANSLEYIISFMTHQCKKLMARFLDFFEVFSFFKRGLNKA